MRLSELIAKTEVLSANLPLDTEIRSLRLDSREVGDLFFAVPGSAADGHRFIPDALRNGAVVVVAEQPQPSEVPCVFVKSVRAAMGEMAAAFYGHPAELLTMIGITGTNGKTTVSYILKSLLEQAGGKKVGLIGTIQTMIGDTVRESSRTTPDVLSLHKLLREMVDAGCDSCVMEVSSHALDQQRVGGLRYHLGVFLGLTQDHLDYHRDMEDYFAAKVKLFDISDAGMVNLDDPWGRKLSANGATRYFSFSTQDNAADVVGKNIRLLQSGVTFEALCGSDIDRIEWATPGAFSVYNALAAVACGWVLGLSAEAMSTAFHSIRPVKGRMEVVPLNAPFTVIVDYAHTHDALENVINTVRGFCKKRIIAVFGCGGDRDKTKRPLMGGVVGELADIAVVTSDNPRTEAPLTIINDILTGMINAKARVEVEEDRVRAIALALSLAREGDVVLLCGKGHELTQEIHGVCHPMDERQVVTEVWRENHD